MNFWQFFAQILPTAFVCITILLIIHWFRQGIDEFLGRMTKASAKVSALDLSFEGEAAKLSQPASESIIAVNATEKSLIQNIHWEKTARLLLFTRRVTVLRQLMQFANPLMTVNPMLVNVDDLENIVDLMIGDTDELNFGSVVYERLISIKSEMITVKGKDKHKRAESIVRIEANLGFVFDYVYSLGKQNESIAAKP